MIYVFGGINLDVVVKIKGNAMMYESNIASIALKAGGVGRNIARAIGNYSSCEFLTCIPNNMYDDMVKDLENNNVSLKHAKFLNDPKSYSMYIDMVDEKGVLLGACDTKALENFTIGDIKDICAKTKDDDIIVIDTNITDLVEYILKNTKGYKMMDAVSSVKLEKVKNFVPLLDFIKVNSYEYEMVRDRMPDNYLITSGHGGTLKYNGSIISFDHKEYKPVNPTGCGDTFFGTFIGNMDKQVKDALTFSIRAAAAASQTDEAVPTLSDIQKIDIKDLDIKWTE